jgi:hypothetical protein
MRIVLAWLSSERESMSPIRIHTTISSETLHLPELRPLLGKAVEIVITEEPVLAADSERWSALAAVAGKDLIDADVYGKQREFDRSCSQAPLL